MPYSGPKITGDITNGSFYESLSEKMSDLAKHTPNKDWNKHQIAIANAAFKLNQLYEQNTFTMDDDDQNDNWKK